MGTTLTAVYVGEEEVAIAHVGDSRAYCLRDGELLRLTDDHSLVDELMRQGRLTPEEAVEHPQRSVITRALGPEGTVEVDTRSLPRPRRRRLPAVQRRPDDDGRRGADRRDRCSAHQRLRDAGEALIAAANEAGGRDNITVVLLRLEEVELAARRPRRAADRDRTAGGSSDAAAARRRARPSDGATPARTRPAGVAARHAADAPAPPRAGSLPAPGDERPPGTLRLRRARCARRPARRARRPRVGRLPGVAVGLLHRDQQPGLVTLFSGLPYELPGGLTLYSSQLRLRA